MDIHPLQNQAANIQLQHRNILSNNKLPTVGPRNHSQLMHPRLTHRLPNLSHHPQHKATHHLPKVTHHPPAKITHHLLKATHHLLPKTTHHLRQCHKHLIAVATLQQAQGLMCKASSQVTRITAVIIRCRQAWDTPLVPLPLHLQLMTILGEKIDNGNRIYLQ